MNDKPDDKAAKAAATTEDDLRKAAVDFAAAMEKAQDEGYDFVWPVNSTEMRNLAVSQGAKPAATKKAR